MKSTEIAERKAKEIGTLTERMKEAMDALDLACNQFKKETMEWTMEGLPNALKDVRALRMSLTAEFSLLLKPLEDLRKFFVGREYETETARLREFVELCERLKALKESGFLDTVADTMLRLA